MIMRIDTDHHGRGFDLSAEPSLHVISGRKKQALPIAKVEADVLLETLSDPRERVPVVVTADGRSVLVRDGQETEVLVFASRLELVQHLWEGVHDDCTSLHVLFQLGALTLQPPDRAPREPAPGPRG